MIFTQGSVQISYHSILDLCESPPRSHAIFCKFPFYKLNRICNSHTRGLPSPHWVSDMIFEQSHTKHIGDQFDFLQELPWYASNHFVQQPATAVTSYLSEASQYQWCRVLQLRWSSTLFTAMLTEPTPFLPTIPILGHLLVQEELFYHDRTGV